jgi:hypothetical protein
MAEEDIVQHRLDARYANDFRIGFNRDEFIVEVGQSFDGTEAFYTRLVCTPARVQSLLGLLRQSLEAYEREYGPIPTLESD